VKTLNRDRIVRSGALVGVPVPLPFCAALPIPLKAQSQQGCQPRCLGERFGKKRRSSSVMKMTDLSELLTEAPRSISQLDD